MQISTKAFSQTTVLSLDFKNISIEQVLNEIEAKTTYRFLYNKNLVDLSRKVSIVSKQKTVSKILDQILDGTGIISSINGNQIVLSKAEKKTTPEVIKKISGTITDKNGEPIIGASVLVKNSKLRTVTDANGNYSINAPDHSVLSISYIGYEPTESLVNTQKNMSTILEEKSKDVGEVVVIGYGSQKRTAVVSSIATIQGKDLLLPNRSLQNGLSGQVAGLISVQRSGEPGYDNAEIYIRGISSFTGNTSALVLVDGVPRKMSDISPEEIESFTILKDASATSVYGAEGANGVILITSKRGKMQKTSIQFRADNYMNEPTRVMSFLGSPDFLRMYNEAKWNTEGNPNSASFVPFKTDAQIAKYESGEDTDLYPNTNWMNLLKKNTFAQRYSLNFRGGSEKLKFFVASSYFKEGGLFKSNPVDANEFVKEAKYSTNIGVVRYNIRSNVDMEVTKSTKLNVDMSMQYLTTNYPGNGTKAIFNSMTSSAPYLTPMIYSNGYPAKSVNSAAYNNPYTMLNLSGYTKEYRVSLQTGIGITQRIDFIRGLSARANISFDADFSSKASRVRTPSQYIATGRDLSSNLTFTKVVNGLNTSTEAAGGAFSDGNKRIYLEGSLNYGRTFGNHNVTAMLLGMQKESQLQGDPYLYKKQSIVGRSGYIYKDKFFIDMSFGFTGSENFAPENRFGFFPALGFGYTISKEKFLKGLADKAHIDRLKLRISFGKTGNDKVSNSRFPYKENLNWTSTAYFMGMSSSGGVASTQNVIAEKQAYNANIHWEIEDKRNLGFDLSMFDGGIELTADYFNNLRHDILLQRNTVPGVAGLQVNPFQNYGKMSNKGVDASLNMSKKFGKIGVNFKSTFTYAHNKILEMDEVSRLYAYQNQTGSSLNTLDAWVADRLYTNEDFNIAVNPSTGAKTYTLKPTLPQLGVGFGTVAPGNIKYVDLNNDNIIDNNDWTRNPPNAKPTTPEIIYGFGLGFTYKGFNVGSFFQGSANSSVFMDPSFMIPFAATDPKTTSAKAFSTDRWTESNPNPYALIPRTELGKNINDNRRSTWWTRSGNYLRFKNLEFGYSFNKKTMEKLKIQALRIYVMGQNLAVWDHIKYWDPEQGGSADGSNYPIQRSFNAGFEITF